MFTENSENQENQNQEQNPEVEASLWGFDPEEENPNNGSDNNGEENGQSQGPNASNAEENSDLEINDELLAKLKDQGYNVSKEEEQKIDPNDIKDSNKEEYEIAVKTLERAKGFLAQDDLSIVRSHELRELSKEFEKQGRNPNSEDFKLELEDIMENHKENKTLLGLQADRIRTKIKEEVLRPTENVISDYKKNLELKEKLKVQERNSKIDESSRSLKESKKLFGVKIEDSQIEDSMKYVKSGDLFKDLNNDPELALKVALVAKNINMFDALESRKSYGEGVEEILSQLQGEDPEAISHLSRSLKNRSKLQSDSSFDTWNKNAQSSQGGQIVV